MENRVYNEYNVEELQSSFGYVSLLHSIVFVPPLGITPFSFLGKLVQAAWWFVSTPTITP